MLPRRRFYKSRILLRIHPLSLHIRLLLSPRSSLEKATRPPLSCQPLAFGLSFNIILERDVLGSHRTQILSLSSQLGLDHRAGGDAEVILVHETAWADLLTRAAALAIYMTR